LNVAGWWDQEDFYGPVATYERLEKVDKQKYNFLDRGAVESWRLGPRAREIVGRDSLRQRTSVYFRQKIEAPWFAYWLKDKGKLPLKEALPVSDGQRYMDIFRCLATARGQTAQLIIPPGRQVVFRSAGVKRGGRF